MIVFSDLHLRDESEETVFDQVFPGLFHAASHDPDKTLVCLGDFWHIRYRVSVRLQNRVMKFLDALGKAKIRFILLPGNHDQISVEGENAMEVFDSLPNVSVYTDPTWDRWGFWIPYRKNNADIVDALALAEKQLGSGVTPVLWMHHGMKGASMNNTIVNSNGIDPSYFSKWLVFTGHYHSRQKVGNVQYIGSPYQINASEAGQDKGYAIWESKTMQMSPVTMEWGKRYHNLGLVDPDAVDLSSIREGDEVRAIAPMGMKPEDLGRLLGKSGGNCVVTPALEASENRLAVKDRAGMIDYVKEYVRQFHATLDKDQLMAVYLRVSDR